MQSRACTLMIAIALAPQALTAQATPGTKPPAEAPVRSTSPVADGLRAMHQRFSGILIAAAEAMPADKYNYRPTPAQMSFAQIQVHLANEGNDILCGNTAGLAVPQRAAVDSTATKEQLVARLEAGRPDLDVRHEHDAGDRSPHHGGRLVGSLQPGSELPAAERHPAAHGAASHVDTSPPDPLSTTWRGGTAVEDRTV